MPFPYTGLWRLAIPSVAKGDVHAGENDLYNGVIYA